MDRVIYIAMNGAEQALHAQQIHSNNLANASTTGFKNELTFYTSFDIEGEGYDVRTASVIHSPISDFTPGALITTGRDLDVAIEDEGFLAIQDEFGQEAYTRNGSLEISPQGLLMTSNGHAVLGQGGPIVLPPADKIQIAKNGMISIKPSGSDTETMVLIDRIKLVNPDLQQLRKQDSGLFKMEGGELVEADENVTILTGSLEGSNVNLVGSLVDMIANARHYETQVKMMENAETVDRVASSIMDAR